MSCKAMIEPGSLGPLWKIPVTIICTDWIKKKRSENSRSKKNRKTYKEGCGEVLSESAAQVHLD